MSSVEQDPSKNHHWLSITVLMALSIALLNAFIGETIPLMIVDLRHQMQLTNEQAGLLRFAPAAAGLLIAPSAGAITDTLGAKRTLTAALILFASGALVIALSPNSLVLILGLLVLGLGNMSTSVVAYAMLTKSAANSKQLGIYIAAWGITFNIGYLLFPPISGWLLTQTDRSWIVVGKLAMATSIILLIANIRLNNDQTTSDAKGATNWG